MTTEAAGCDAVLFDVDGTLLDTIPLIVETYHVVFERFLGHTGNDRDILASIGLPLDAYLQQVSPTLSEEMTAAYLAYNHDRLDTHVAVFLGIHRLLAELRQRNIPLGVVTSKRYDSAVRSLEQFGLLGFFKIVITKESTSRHKPFADPILAAMSQLGLANPENLVYVGDSLHDHLSARAAGCRSVLVGWTKMPVEDLKAAGPDLWLERPEQLTSWLDQGLPHPGTVQPEDG